MSEGATILVVEDNEANQMLARALLELEGHLVEVAGSAAEAAERLRVLVPDLILMDVQLPGEDGLSLTRRLKADLHTAAIPVVALTARAMSGDREMALAAGCSGYISKPIDTHAFGAQVRSFLAGVGGGEHLVAS